MSKEKEQFDSLGSDYSSFVAIDPIRNDLHYPSMKNSLGDLADKHVLDIGCGDGAFDRMLVSATGARVDGFDIAPHLIDIARQNERVSPLGINYTVSDHIGFTSGAPYDKAVTVMVLPYASDRKDLESFLMCASRNLKKEGVFHSIIFNPSFNEFDKLIANRRFVQLGGRKVEVNFLDPISKEKQFKSILTQYTQHDYEKAIQSAGFEQAVFNIMKPTRLAMQRLGKEFWKDCISSQPYSLMVCKKS